MQTETKIQLFAVEYLDLCRKENRLLQIFSSKLEARKYIARLLRNSSYDVKVIKKGSNWHITHIPTMDYGVLKLS